ncbi:MAG: ATP-dependent DNA helicase [Bacteroidetes bacterium]|nr:MAG: ATP-dependent DNA helicase [Bacteroidota bacterium]
MEFLNDLNEAQRAAVTHIEGPQMVIAGAGSGKTRVLTYRLAFILDQGLAYPQELLALTFTNKAAREMKDRIFRLVGPEGKSVVMGTFHSIFSRILRVEAEKIGYTSSYTIYDSDDSQRLVKKIVKEKGLDDKIFKPRVIAHGISGAKNRLISPKQFKEHAIDDFNQRVGEIYHLYELSLRKANAMDFDDLLVKSIYLFQTLPDVLYKYQHRFKYIMVDEYQDTNHAQYLLTKMLAAVHENICVVGDDAQSIYAFRGANIQNILNFQKDYPDVKVFKLEQNYRSTQNIVNAANSVIARNKDQIQKKVFTLNEEGELIHLVESSSEQEEARRVSSMIREQKQLYNFFNRDFAVLYRTNAQSRAIEDEMRRSGLKYKVFGGLSFYQRKEIKDVVAYMRLAINPLDDQALLRVINYPKRGIGKTTIDKLTVYAGKRGLSLWQTLEEAELVGLNKRTTTLLKNFATMIKSYGVLAQKRDAYEVASHIAKHSGILKDLHSENTIEGLGRWENVQELLNAAQGFVESPEQEEVSLESFLADISLFTSQDENPEDDDYVTLMTIHSAKGLEFESVFLVGMEENLFPSALSMESRADLEEERRLFYVAVTRAKKRLTLSYAKSRYRFGQLQFNEPSRFLDEIDEQYLKRPERPALREVRSPIPAERRAAPRQGKLRPLSRAIAGGNDSFQPADPTQIQAGLQVYHQKFGKGKVLNVEGEGPNRKATVHFQQKGQRVLLLKYARLKIIG